MPIRFILRLAGALCLLVAASAAAPSRLDAQLCPPEGCTGAAPTVRILPAEGTWSDTLDTRTVSGSVDWCDDQPLQPGKHRVTLNGQPVATSSGMPDAAWCSDGFGSRSVFTVTLEHGGHTLAASTEDAEGLRGHASASYAYHRQMPPSPAAPPAGLPCFVSRAEAVKAMYLRVLEREADPGGLSHYVGVLAGGSTVRSIVLGMAQSSEHQGRFIFPDGRKTLTYLYRHLLAREPDANAWGWVDVAATHGWNFVAHQLAYSQEYTDRFGDRAVPGDPVAAWDCGREGLALDPANAAPVLERDLCLTVSAGDGAAYECGDLRLVHALPTLYTLNKARTPTLIYNQALVDPHPIVSAYVTLPAGVSADTVRATLTRADGAHLASGKWPAWAPGQERRVALLFSASGWQTGVYGYTLQVRVTSGASTAATYSARGELGVVNRNGSPFGAGWWLAGLEKLNFLSDGRIFWVGGDGSFRVYRPLGGTPARWVSAHVADRPDTLYTTSHPYSAFERRLPGGTRVIYNGSGHHVTTINRLDHQTNFGYHNDLGLAFIAVPRQPGYGGSEVRYNFELGGAAGRLWRITTTDLGGTPARTVTINHDATGRVMSITDPDQRSVSFAFNPGWPWWLDARTDRRGTRTRFAFQGTKLVSTTVEMQGTGDDIRLSFTSQEGRGLVNAVPADSVHTLFDGPRPNACVPYQPCVSPAVDETRFWVDRWGAPRRIRNALGHETHLTRADPRFPALVTHMRGPNGLETSAAYDSTGHVESQTVHNPLGDGRSALTTYTWNHKWSVPTRVSAYEVSAAGVRTQLVAPTVVEIDTATGHRLWQQQGDDAARRVAFRYYEGGAARGMLRAVDGPLSNPDSVAYDWYGNLAYQNTGGVPAEYRRDGWGRVYETVTPGPDALNVVSRVMYDVMGRDTLTETGDPLTQAIRVRKQYDAEGNVLSVARMSVPDSAGIGWVVNAWEYDRANRARVEISPDGTPESQADNPRDVTTLDAAGNPVSRRTRRGHDLTFRYDALGRVRSRTVPAAAYGPLNILDVKFFANTVPGETATFTYDELGSLRTADNAVARITREYYPSGAMRAETQHLATWGGSFDPALHVYRLEHGYDLLGRRVWTRHPASIAPRAPGSTTPLDLARYRFSPLTGQLEAVVDVMGHEFRYTYDAEGRLDSLVNVTVNAREDRTYDGNGRLVRREELGGPGYLAQYGSEVLHDDRITGYDRRGKILEVEYGLGAFSPSLGRVSMQYSLLGAMRRSEEFDPRRDADFGMRDIEIYTGDGTGNLYHQTTVPYNADTWITFLYERGTGRRVGSRQQNKGRDTAVFDAAGNREFAALGEGDAKVRVRSLYTAENRLHAVDLLRCVPEATGSTSCKQPAELTDVNASMVEAYRYDALGRRVLVRTDRTNTCTNPTLCHSTIERTVWDGDQILYEIRMPGGTNLPAADLERDTTTIVGEANAPYGRVTYAYGLQLDAPLSIIRMGYTMPRTLMDASQAPASFFEDFYGATAVFPHQTWRGDFDIGTFATGLHERNGIDARCKSYGIQRFCTTVRWPATNTGFQHQQLSLSPSTSWMGSQIDGRRDASGLMYMRNRYYDPATARFTQEDPIGLAGGLNLYGFAAGDPVSFSDPYGLKVCFAGTAAEVGALKTAVEGATGASIELDKSNCITSVGRGRVRAVLELRDRLQFLHAQAETYTVGFTFSESDFRGSSCNQGGTHFCPADLVVELDPTEIAGRRDSRKYVGCTVFGGINAGLGFGIVRHSGETFVAHELLGHAWAYAANKQDNEGVARHAENIFRTRQPGGRAVCGGG